jgi:hypothetical protein
LIGTKSFNRLGAEGLILFTQVKELREDLHACLPKQEDIKHAYVNERA